MPDALVTVFYFFVALFPLVLVHELGHFLFAKLGKVDVEEFGIGFPPRALTLFTLGGTVYSLNWLPLGGFVRLAGEDDPDKPGAFAAASKTVRASVLLAGPVFNFLLAAILLAGIALLWGASEPVLEDEAVLLSSVMADSPAEAAGVLPGDLLVGIDGQAVAERTAAVSAEPPTSPAMQALIDAAGAAEGPLALSLLRGVDETLEVEVPAGGGATAEDAGLAMLTARRVATSGAEAGDESRVQPGDLIVAPAAVASGEAPIAPGATVVVLRGEIAPQEIAVTPEDGKIGVGIGSVSALTQLGLIEAPLYGLERTWFVMTAMVDGLVQMVTGRLDADVAGPVGIARMGRQAGEQGMMTLLAFMALLSINLGIINLLPIPGLDGGRLLFILIEALRGRRIEPTREAVVHFIGIALVIGLMLVITAMEVFRPGIQ